jgi:hypothetical protein
VPKKIEWESKLSMVNKAEILVGVVHILTEHMPKIWAKVPKWYQKQLKQAMWDCSTRMDDFSKQDLKQIRAYFEEFKKKCPDPKTSRGLK